MDNKALFKIGYGLYVLTTTHDGKDNGCIVNTVMQFTDRPLRIGVTVNKANYTHDLIDRSHVFNVSMLTTETPMSLIEHFGFQSGRDTDKFDPCGEEHRDTNHVPYLDKYTNAYLACHVVRTIDFETHTLFVAEIDAAEVLCDKPSLTYDYYMKHIKPQPKNDDTRPANGKRRWVCKVCGWIYEGYELPDDIVCELCKHGKEDFEELFTTENPNDKPLPEEMNQIKLADSIYYVGVNDRHTDLFENHMELPNGVSYNSYLVVDEKVTLIDPVEIGFMAEHLHKIKSIIGSRPIDYLVVNHAEPDHSGSLAFLLKEYPNMTVIGNAKTFAPLEAFYGLIDNKKTVADSETLCTGKHTFQFFSVPMVHWPESMVTYEQSTQIVFSNDAFGGFGVLNGGIFDDQVNLGFYEDDMRRYYANIVGKVACQALKAIQRLGGLNIKMIAPSHGLVWRHDLAWVLDRYTSWSKGDSEEGLVIAYGSMYGNTARMADIIARGAAEAGIKEIKIYDVCKTEVSFIISDIWKYKGVCLGACAHYGNMFPNMNLLVHEINEFKPMNKNYALFGGMSWSGGGVCTLSKHAEAGHWNLVTEPVEVKGAPIREEDVNRLYELGRQMAEAIKA